MRAHATCRAKRWDIPNPNGTPGVTMGQQLMLDHSYKMTNAYKWGGVGVVIFTTILFNILIWVALAVLKGGFLRIPTMQHCRPGCWLQLWLVAKDLQAYSTCSSGWRSRC